MRRLALSNNNISKIDIFKDIFFDPLIGNPNNQVFAQTPI